MNNGIKWYKNVQHATDYVDQTADFKNLFAIINSDHDFILPLKQSCHVGNVQSPAGNMFSHP